MLMPRLPPLPALAGTIERVMFHNAQSGYRVLQVKARTQRDLVTIVGHASTISAGKWMTASGESVNHPHPWPTVQGPAFAHIGAEFA